MNAPKVQIDLNNCINCKTCIQVCPSEIFISADNRTKVNDQNLKYCLSCGDCIAICPETAITHQSAETKEMSRAEEEDFTSEQFLGFLEKRRTIRSYQEGDLTEEEKQYLIRAAAQVPCGGHTEDIRNTGIILVENEEIIEKIIDYSYQYLRLLKKKLTTFWIAIPKLFSRSFRENINSLVERIDKILEARADDINMISYGAPNLILLHAQEDNPVARENLNIMEYQLTLAAEAQNLGSCILGWVSFALKSFKIKEQKKLENLYKKLDIPENKKILTALAIGRKKAQYQRLKARGEKDISVI